MRKIKNILGLTILEGLISTAVVGIGFIAILQMVNYSVQSIDTSGEILKRIPDLPDFMDKANHALQLIAEGKLNLTKSSNTTLEMEKLRLKSFRNNILISILGIVIITFVVF